MKIEQNSHRVLPVTRAARVYNFPSRPRWEQEELTRDMIRAREELRLREEERQEVAKFNSQMDWVGRVGLVLVALLGVAVIVAQIAIRMGR
jgi:hypothetical protein